MVPAQWARKIDALSYVGERLQWLLKKQQPEALYAEAQQRNPFFTPSNIAFALSHIVHNYLDRKKLQTWIKKYVPQFEQDPAVLDVGMVLAGNIPLVGFHDVLVGYMSPHRLQVKLSHNDPVLIPWLVDLMGHFDPEVKARIRFVDRLREFDAVIATGSDTSAHYFNYYFRDVPRVIRRTRHSVGILSEDMSDVDIQNVGEDVFLYFGLGCRNLTLLWLPRGFDIQRLRAVWVKDWAHLLDHPKYANNYLYWKSIFSVDNIPHEDFGFVLLREAHSLASGLGVVHYAWYDTIDEVKAFLRRHKSQLQCVVCVGGAICYDRVIQVTRPGKAQRPSLRSYADGVDTMAFLLGLRK